MSVLQVICGLVGLTGASASYAYGTKFEKQITVDEKFDRIYGNASGSSLKCKNCGKLIGSLMIYEKEDRPAYAILLGTIKNKIVKLS